MKLKLFKFFLAPIFLTSALTSCVKVGTGIVTQPDPTETITTTKLTEIVLNQAKPFIEPIDSTQVLYNPFTGSHTINLREIVNGDTDYQINLNDAFYEVVYEVYTNGYFDKLMRSTREFTIGDFDLDIDLMITNSNSVPMVAEIDLKEFVLPKERVSYTFNAVTLQDQILSEVEMVNDNSDLPTITQVAQKNADILVKSLHLLNTEIPGLPRNVIQKEEVILKPSFFDFSTFKTRDYFPADMSQAKEKLRNDVNQNDVQSAVLLMNDNVKIRSSDPNKKISFINSLRSNLDSLGSHAFMLRRSSVIVLGDNIEISDVRIFTANYDKTIPNPKNPSWQAMFVASDNFSLTNSELYGIGYEQYHKLKNQLITEDDLDMFETMYMTKRLDNNPLENAREKYSKKYHISKNKFSYGKTPIVNGPGLGILQEENVDRRDLMISDNNFYKSSLVLTENINGIGWLTNSLVLPTMVNNYFSEGLTSSTNYVDGDGVLENDGRKYYIRLITMQALTEEDYYVTWYSSVIASNNTFENYTPVARPSAYRKKVYLQSVHITDAIYNDPTKTISVGSILFPPSAFELDQNTPDNATGAKAYKLTSSILDALHVVYYLSPDR